MHLNLISYLKYGTISYSFLRSQREDEIEEYYRTKFGTATTAERYGEGEEMSDEITQQGRLPGVKLVPLCNYIMRLFRLLLSIISQIWNDV